MKLQPDKYISKSIIWVLVILLTAVFSTSARADGDPERQTTLEVKIVEHEWWLVYWQEGSRACTIFVDHEGEPTREEIRIQCGQKVFSLWINSSPCLMAESDLPEKCPGMYLHHTGSQEKNKLLEIELPIPRVWVELDDCTSVKGTEICAELPSLLIIAEEPLPNEKIEKVQGNLDEVPFLCFGSICELPLQATGDMGVNIEFWADSSFGDSTREYQGRIRVAETTIDDPFISGWRVDIVSGRDDLNTLDGCNKIWESFPALGTPPDWLSDPQHPRLLETDEPYAFLAGKLIQKGYVDTSECEYYGLLPNDYASTCGLEKSRAAVKLWQNTFDEYIVNVSRDSGIPSQLLKRIFAKETQFWPATARHTYYEYGLGHINELGADTTLLWNRDFYEQFCPLVLDINVCKSGYANLSDWGKVLLRGAFLTELEIDLPFRDLSVDPVQAQASVFLFAETLLGNCSQVRQMIVNETGRVPGEIVSNEDLWRFTLANYHAGSGCMASAISEVVGGDQSLTWENIAVDLAANCPWAVDYVDGIVY